MDAHILIQFLRNKMKNGKNLLKIETHENQFNFLN